MNKIRPGLGRGLDALINPQMREAMNREVNLEDTNITEDDGKSIDVLAKIPTANVSPNPYQPRTEFEPKALDELKKSILENGLIQPITVRRSAREHFELISGERRLRAFKDIGYKTIPAYIIKVETKEAMLALSLIENIQREKLNAIEVARAYKRLLEECDLSQEQIAEKVGKDRTTITNTMRLLKLPHIVQESIIKEEISAGHARALINLPDEQIQIAMLNKIKKNNLPVRKVEAIVKEFISGKKSFKQKDISHKTVQAFISQKDIENKLRNIFGTKVLCRQKKTGAGEITIEFYSNEELERLFDLFDQIENSN